MHFHSTFPILNKLKYTHSIVFNKLSESFLRVDLTARFRGGGLLNLTSSGGSGLTAHAGGVD